MKRAAVFSTNLPLVISVVIFLLVAGAIFSAVNTLITVYNTIVQSKVRVERSLGDLESIYQRRYALVENLVVLVKETKTFERFQIEVEQDLLPKVAEAKAQATKLTVEFPTQVAQRLTQETRLSNFLLQTLDKLLVQAQHYPTITDPVLKERTATFQALDGLKTSLMELESSVQDHRKWLNESVRVYNQNIQIFPANLFAPTWGFTAMAGFEVLSPDARHDPKLAF